MKKKMKKKTDRKFSNIIAAISSHKILIIAITVFLAIICAISFISYETKRKELIFSTYATVNDYKISNLEYMYYYQKFKSDNMSQNSSYFSNLEIPKGELLEQQIYNEETGETWGDYFSKYGFQYLLELHFVYELALENNYVLDNVDKLVEKEIDNLKHNALDKNISFKKYLSDTFIKDVKEKEIREVIKKYIISINYKDEYKNSIEVTQDEIDQYYEDNKDKYDVVSYRIYSFSVYKEYLSIINNNATSSATDTNTNSESDKEDEEETLTKEEILESPEFIKAKDTMLQNATDFYNQVYDDETFKTLCLSQITDEAEKEKYKEKDSSLKTNITSEDVPDALKDWLFDNNRETKSTAIIYDEETLSYYVIYFVERQKNLTEYVQIKNIFIPYETSDEITFTITEEDKEKAKNQADKIMEEWNASDKTSKTFSEIAKKYTKNYNKKIDYINYLKEELPPVFAEWSYSSERNPGDCEVFNDNNGYYITYFDKNSESVLSEKIKAEIIENKFYDTMKEMSNTHSINFPN